MKRPPNVVVVLGRCCRSREPFGIRLEEKDRGQWLADWAFTVKEASARREGYDRGEIRGMFHLDAGYPGCPTCRAKGFVQCGTCGKLFCWDGESQMVTCPWCGAGGKVEGRITQLAASGDR